MASTSSAPSPALPEAAASSSGTPVKKRPGTTFTLSFGESLLAGGLSGAIAKTSIAPMDRQKIIFQVTSKRFSIAKAFKAMKHTYQTEGLAALYRGNSATMVRIIPYASIQYMAFEQYKKVALEYHHHELTPFLRFLCGGAAGATSVAATYPLDLMRARLAYSNVSRGLVNSLIHSVKHDGLGDLFHGLKPTFIGQIFYSGISFSIFETLKAIGSDPSGHLTSPDRFMFGAVAGVVAQTCTYPLDVVRRRMQIDPAHAPRYTGIMHALTTIYREEGLISGLYKGLSMNWIKGPISVGISFSVFDFVKSTIIQRHIEAEQK